MGLRSELVTGRLHVRLRDWHCTKNVFVIDKNPALRCLFVLSSDRSTQQQVILQARSAAPMMKMEGVFWQGGAFIFHKCICQRERKWKNSLKQNMRVSAGEFVCSNLCCSIRSVQQPTGGSSSEPQTQHLRPLRGRSLGSVRLRYRRPEWEGRRPRVVGPGRPVRWLGVQTTERYKVLFQHLFTLLMSFRILLQTLLFPNL